MDLLGLDSSEDGDDFLQTVDLPEKVCDDRSEILMTPPQSAEWSSACTLDIDRDIYTIHEAEEKMTLSYEEKKTLSTLLLANT